LLPFWRSHFLPPRELLSKVPQFLRNSESAAPFPNRSFSPLLDLKKMPRRSISLVNPHDKKKESYEGVLLEELLHRAGVPQGEQLRGRAMAESRVYHDLFLIAARKTEAIQFNSGRCQPFATDAAKPR
jgi:hypothetical protein